MSLLSFVAVLLATATGADPERVVAVEWLPLEAHSQAIRAIEAACESHPSLDRLNAYGDDAELEKLTESLQKGNCALALGFGERVTRKMAALAPDVPLLGMLVRQTPARKQDLSNRMAPLGYILAEPEPSLVWDVATQVLPKGRVLAVLYSEGFAPNVTMAEALEREAAKRGARVVRLTVPAGNCRTDSDFDKALQGLAAAPGEALLYVPDDPNGARFGSVICRYAAERKIPVIGTECVAGKGAVATLALDYAELGRVCAQWMQRAGTTTGVTEVIHAPYRVVVEPEAMANQGIPVSEGLKRMAGTR